MHDWHQFRYAPNCLSQGNYKIFEPASRAEILNWFSQTTVSDLQKEALIQALMAFEDDCGDFFHYRAFFVAAEALAYFPSCQMGDAIVDRLLKYSYAYFQQEKQDWKKYPQPLAETARATVFLTDRSRIIARFIQLLHTTDSRFVLRHAAEQLGKIDPGNNSAIAVLAGLIQVSDNPSAHLKTAKALMKLAPTHPLLLPTFTQLTQVDCKQWWIVRDAIISLGNLQIDHEAATQALLQFRETCSPELLPLSCFVTEALGKVGRGNESAISALVMQPLGTCEGSLEWFNAVEAWEQIGRHHPTAIAQLLEELETHHYTSPNASNRCSLAVCLLKIDPGNSIATTILVQLLQARVNLPSQWRSAICWRSADSLIGVDSYHSLVVDTLLEIAEAAYNNYPPLPVIYSLNRIDPTHQLAISTLVQLLQTSQICKWQIAEELGELGVDNPIAIDALTQLIATTEDELDLRCAAASLGKIDPGNPLAINTLIKLVQMSENSYSRLEALYSLGQIGVGSQVAVEALMQFLQTFEDDPENQEYVWRLATDWKETLLSNHLSQVVIDLRNCMSEPAYQSSSYRYDACDRLLWDCAQQMPYPDFYLAYHQAKNE